MALSKILLLIVSVIVQGFRVTENDAKLNLAKVSSRNLSLWYDALAVCMIQSEFQKNSSYWTILPKCKENLPKGFNVIYNDGFFTLPSSAFANKVRGCCCTEDMPLSERGFDNIVEGFDDPLSKPLLDFFLELSLKNKSLLLLGDSMNSQYLAAIQEEMRREVGFEIVVMEPLDNRWYYKRLPDVNMTHKNMKHLRALSLFDPKQLPISLNTKNCSFPVFVYDFSVTNMRSAEEENLMERFIPFLSRHEHPAGIAFFANIGHHLAGERGHKNIEVMNSKMSVFLLWLDRIGKLNHQNVVSFRETTPSHFDSPDRDGSFEKWKGSVKSHYDYLKVNSWDNSLYYCRNILNASEPSQNTPENLAVRKLFNAWATPHFTILPVFKYFAPFYKLKYGHCGGYSRISVIDCVHLCSFAPTMWFPLWVEMAALVRQKSEQERSTSSVPLIFENMSISDSGVVVHILKKFSKNKDSTNKDSTYKDSTSDRYDYYLLKDGLSRHIPSTDYITHRLGAIDAQCVSPHILIEDA